jgi:hypothetical protein
MAFGMKRVASTEIGAPICTSVNSILYRRTILLGLYQVVIVLMSLLAEFIGTGNIKKRKIVERSPNDIEAPVVALL